MKIYFASGNEHKKKEIEKLFKGHRIVLPKEEGLEFDPVEDGTSFSENAEIKARALWNVVHAPTLSDDSGLSVDALSGRPGIYSARYGEKDGEKLPDGERNALLLKEMEGKENRSAHFVSSLYFIFDEDREYSVTEKVDGYLSYTPSGKNGFGYDPIFILSDLNRSMAELTEDEKNMCSHRAKSARMMNAIIKRLEEEL